MATVGRAQQMLPDLPLSVGEDQQAADRINEAILVAYGFGNTFMVTTRAGNVIIDTSSVVDSFPNMYTLRGTKPRWALDYIDSINKVLALKPEILLPSHG